MPTCYDTALSEFTREVDAIRRYLHDADVGAVHLNPAIRERAGAAKAFSYVWLSASLEQFVRGFLESLSRELTSRQIPRSDLRRCLLALCDFPHFDALREVGGLPMWSRRVEVMARTESRDAAVFSDVVFPLDGRTLRPEHFETIWRIFGLPGVPLPSGRHSFALNDLADGRNAVAHGRSSPSAFGRSKVMADVLRIVDFIEDVVLETAVAADTYLRAHQYRR